MTYASKHTTDVIVNVNAVECMNINVKTDCNERMNDNASSGIDYIGNVDESSVSSAAMSFEVSDTSATLSVEHVGEVLEVYCGDDADDKDESVLIEIFRDTDCSIKIDNGNYVNSNNKNNYKNNDNDKNCADNYYHDNNDNYDNNDSNASNNNNENNDNVDDNYYCNNNDESENNNNNLLIIDGGLF